MKMHRNLLAAFASSAMVLSGAALVATPAVAQDDEEGGGNTRRSATLDPAVGRVIAPIYENEIANELWGECIRKIQELINQRGSRFKPYDTAIVNQLLGQCQAGQENFRGALTSFQRAVDSNGLPPEQVNGVRYVIAQLYFQLQDYNGAIRSLNQWIRAGGTPDANAYYLLAAAHTQKEPADYRAAQSPAEQALRLREQAKKSDFDLMNLIYSENNERTKRAALLERMINIWPGEGSYWRQLSGLYSQTGQDKQAFSVLEVAYRAGLLNKESEISTLVQYYSFFNNPYRGAQLLDREMNAGNVPRNVKNLRLLSQLWSQSREHKRAIPVLQEAAERSDDGELYYRLGQVLLADEQYALAERALAQARAKGGLTSRQQGDSWMLTGTARFSQAGPEDREQRSRARTAFQNATRFQTSAAQARDWVAYIDAIVAVERAQDRLARQQAEEERRDTINRLRQQVTVCNLQGQATAECDDIRQRLEQLLADDEAARRAPPPGESTDGAAAEQESSGATDSDAETSTDGVSGDEQPATVGPDGAADEG